MFTIKLTGLRCRLWSVTKVLPTIKYRFNDASLLEIIPLFIRKRRHSHIIAITGDDFQFTFFELVSQLNLITFVAGEKALEPLGKFPADGHYCRLHCRW